MSSFTELVVSECNGGSERSEANGCGCGANNNQGGRLYKLSQPFTYAIGRKGAGAIVNIPVDFVTDFESIPKLLSGVIKKQPHLRPAFVVHDWLCATKTPWHIGTYIMVDALKTLNCPWLKRNLLYGLPVLLWGIFRKTKRGESPSKVTSVKLKKKS